MEIYQQEHYKTQVKPTVNEMSKKHHDETGVSLDKSTRLKLVKEVTKEKFVEEPQQVKDDIAIKTSMQPDLHPKESSSDLMPQTPEQFLRYVIWLFDLVVIFNHCIHSAIKDLAVMLPQAMEKFCHKTGWYGIMTFGGPNPANGRKIDTFRWITSLKYDFYLLH